MCECVYVYMCICVYVCVYVYMYVCVCMCVCMYALTNKQRMKVTNYSSWESKGLQLVEKFLAFYGTWRLIMHSQIAATCLSKMGSKGFPKRR
jgi:hypothetical protein